MMEADLRPDSGGGMLETAKRFWSTFRNALENRVDLFLLELKEERIRVVDTVLLVAVIVVCAAMALVLVTFTLVVIFWDSHRLLALGVLSGLYAAGAGTSFWALRRHLRQWEFLKATREQLKKDRACLETRN
jgi:uncharacterized membrane protein YqjE